MEINSDEPINEPVFEMFNPELMENFRRHDYDSCSDYNKARTCNAWLIFVYKLLPLVNEEWGRVLKGNHIQEKPNIYDYTSLSDEVLARWVIKCKYQKLMEDKKSNWPERGADKKGKKEGPHESRVLLKMYCEEYNKTKDSFQLKNKDECKKIQEKWNDLFWHEMEDSHPEKFKAKEMKKKSYNADNAKLPGMDDDW